MSDSGNEQVVKRTKPNDDDVIVEDEDKKVSATMVQGDAVETEGVTEDEVVEVPAGIVVFFRLFF